MATNLVHQSFLCFKCSKDAWGGLGKSDITLRRVRSPVASFVWRLLNRSLPWATYSLCPLCAEDKVSINYMFIKCPALAGSFTSNPLVTILSPPHASNKCALLALWALWKTICWVQHSSGLDTKTVDLSQVALQHYHLEVNRAQEQNWL